MQRARRAIAAVSRGGIGTAAASLAPRVSSVAAQWLLALTTGPAAVALFVSCTSRGAAVVATVAAGMTPVIVGRPRLLSSRRGRALLACAIAWIAAAALLIAFGVERATEPVGRTGIAAALFAGSTVFYSCAPAAWASFQSRDRFARVLGGSLLFTPLASSLAALAGAPLVAAVLVGLGGAFPAAAMLGRASARRSIRLALWLARRAIPLSLLSMATAIVYPVALSLGMDRLGAPAVGVQTLFWSLVTVSNVASQSFAARVLVAAGGEPGERDMRRWLAAAGALLLLPAIALVVFRLRFGAEVLPRFILAGAAVFLVTDGLTFYFAPASARPAVMGVTFAGAALVTAGVLWHPAVLERVTVLGPSVAIATLRLFPLLAVPRVRAVARAALGALAIAIGLALVFP